MHCAGGYLHARDHCAAEREREAAIPGPSSLSNPLLSKARHFKLSSGSSVFGRFETAELWTINLSVPLLSFR